MAKPGTCQNTGRVFIDNSGTPDSTPAITYAPVPTFTPAQISASASALGQLRRYMDKDLRTNTKLAIESFVKGQEHGLF